MDKERPVRPVSCPSCGADNPSTSTYCAYCGTLLPSQEEERTEPSGSSQPSRGGTGPIGERFDAPKVGFKRTPLALFILLAIVTFGIYPSFWVYLRRKSFNALSSTERFSDLVALLPLGVLILSGFISASLSEGGQAWISAVSYGLWIWIAFKMRTMLRDHVATLSPSYAETNVAPSALLTFFFTVFYIQHQINGLIDVDILRRTN